MCADNENKKGKFTSSYPISNKYMLGCKFILYANDFSSFGFRFYQRWTFCSRPTSTSFKKCILFMQFGANRINLLLFWRGTTALVGIHSLT
jgi:hypothetical protein